MLTNGAAQSSTRHCFGPAVGVSSVTGDVTRHSTHSWTTPVAYGLDGSTTSAAIEEEGLVVVTDTGGIRLQLAQNTADTTPSVLSANSFVYAIRPA